MHSDRLSSTDAQGEHPAPPPVQIAASHFQKNQYAQLKRLIKQNGLLDRQPAYYAGKTVFTLIRGFCRDHCIAYHETSVLQSCKEILQHLHEVGAPLREARKAR